VQGIEIKPRMGMKVETIKVQVDNVDDEEQPWMQSIPDRAVASLPNNRAYQVKMDTTTSGTFDVNVYYDDLEVVSYNDIPITEGQTATVPVDYSSREQKITVDDKQYDPSKAGVQSSIVDISPSTAETGTTIDLSITAQNSHFINGVSQFIVPAGITVNSFTVIDTNHAVANVTIGSDSLPVPMHCQYKQEKNLACP